MDHSKIRNIVILGPSTAGKTTLTEALAYRMGIITAGGSIEQGNTLADFDEGRQAFLEKRKANFKTK